MFVSAVAVAAAVEPLGDEVKIGLGTSDHDGSCCRVHQGANDRQRMRS